MTFSQESEAIMEEANLTKEERNVLADLSRKDFLACRGYCEHTDNQMFMQAIVHLESKGLKKRFVDATNRCLSGFSDNPMLEDGIANEY